MARMTHHLVRDPHHGVVGRSCYAEKLRKIIRQTAADSQKKPLLIHGESGLEKDNIVRRIHFGSKGRNHLLMRLHAIESNPNGVGLITVKKLLVSVC